MIAAAGRWALVLLTVAGLAIDAYVHLDLASRYDAIASTTLSQGDLFRVEAGAAIVAGLLLLLRPRAWTIAVATVVLAGGAAALFVYRYWDVPAFGPIPRMYEPAWYPEKTLAVAAQVIGAAGGAVALASELGRRAADRLSAEPDA